MSVGLFGLQGFDIDCTLGSYQERQTWCFVGTRLLCLYKDVSGTATTVERDSVDLLQTENSGIAS